MQRQASIEGQGYKTCKLAARLQSLRVGACREEPESEHRHVENMLHNCNCNCNCHHLNCSVLCLAQELEQRATHARDMLEVNSADR